MLFNKLLSLLPRPYLALFILLTVIISFVGILLNSDNILGLAIITIASIGLQIWVVQSAKISNKLAPLRRLTNKSIIDLNENIIKFAPYMLLFLPVIAIFWFPVSLFILLIIILFFVPLMFSQAKTILNRKKNLEYLKKEYKNNPPEIIVYLSGPPQVSYQINQWLPVLEKLPYKIAIILRNSSIFNGMPPTKIDIYFVRSGRELEWLLTNGPKIILYPNNRQKNANALRYSGLMHIFINHGESDKATNQSKMLMAYDYLFVGGPLAESRLHEAQLPVRNNQIIYTGRPQAGLAIKSNDKLPRKIVKLLYAPTWEGDANITSYSSVNSFGLEMLKVLIASNRFEIKIKPHPFTGTNKKEIKKALAQMHALCKRNKNAQILDVNSSLHDAMNWSDILICDISAVLNEYLISKKPIILCNVMRKSQSLPEIHSEFPSSKAANILTSGNQIIGVIDEIEQADPLKKQRERIYQASLGGDNSFERFEKALRKLLG